MPGAERQFEILLLGPPLIRWQGKPFSLSGRQNRLIIYYLAACHKTVERLSLVNLIWPEDEQTDISRQLRQALSRLRRALPERDLLIENRDELSLDWSRVSCDVDVFERLLSSCARLVEHEQRSIPLPQAHLVETMYQAIHLWRGTRLLQSIDLAGSPDLESWFLQLEQTLEVGRRWLLERLIDHESANHRPMEALKLAQAALVGNELDDNLHERILNLLIRTGQRSQARQHYLRMKAEFRRADLPLNRALEIIGTQLESPARRQKTSQPGPGQAAGSGLSQPVLSANPKSNWPAYHFGNAPFIGRMIILDALLQIAQRGGGALIYGESGQGKTRLLKEFYSHLTPPPRLILAASQPGESSLPFQPLINALNQQISPAEWLRLPATWAGYLSLLFPDLSRKRTGLRVPNTEDPDLVRVHIFRALSELFNQLAERQADNRLVLILDDAHWADESTLQALIYLFSHPPFNQRGLIILAARVEESTPALIALDNHLGKSERFSKLRMQNLNEPAIAQLVAHYIQEDPPSEFIQQLKKATGGNPLYIIEMMHDILQNGIPLTQMALMDPGNPMPDHMLDIMHYRLDLLTPEARHVIEMLAILGGDIDVHRLNRLATYMQWNDIHAIVDQLTQSGLITRSASTLLQGAGARFHFFFTHDKFREATMLSIPEGQLSLLHLKAADLLKEEIGERINDQSALIAQHFEAGGNLAEAFHYWVWAAQQSLRLSALNTALDQYHHADSLILDCIQDISDHDLYLLFRSWTNFLNTANDSNGLEKLAGRLSYLGAHFDRPILLGMSQHIKTVAAFTRNEIETGLELVKGYQGYMEKSGHPNALAEVYTQKGILHYMIGDITASLEALHKGLKVLTDMPRLDFIAADQVRMVHYEISLAETLGGRPAAAYKYAIAALNALESVGSPTVTSYCHSSAALSSYFSGELRKGIQHCHDGLALAYHNSALRGIGYLSLYYGMNQADLGDLESSLANIEIAEEFGRRYERREIYSFANRIRGDIFFKLGDFAKAASYHQKAYEENPDLFAATDYQIRLAMAKIQTIEDLDCEECQALRRKTQQLALQSKERGLYLGVHYAAQFEMGYWVRRQDWAKLRALVEQEQPALAVNGLMPFWFSAEYLLAEADYANGQYTKARQRLAEMAGWAKQNGQLWLEIKAIRGQIQIIYELRHTMPMEMIERLEALLSYLKEHSQHDLVRTTVEQFCEKIQKQRAFPYPNKAQIR
jgi:DNA-binding SARP family transcriptional activator